MLLLGVRGEQEVVLHGDVVVYHDLDVSHDFSIASCGLVCHAFQAQCRIVGLKNALRLRVENKRDGEQAFDPFCVLNVDVSLDLSGRYCRGLRLRIVKQPRGWVTCLSYGGETKLPLGSKTEPVNMPCHTYKLVSPVCLEGIYTIESASTSVQDPSPHVNNSNLMRLTFHSVTGRHAGLAFLFLLVWFFGIT